MPTGSRDDAEGVPLRAVFDTNVLISGTISSGRARMLIEAAVDGRVRLVISRGLVKEFSGVIAREKFGLSREEQARLVGFVVNLGEMVSTRSRFKAVKEDPDDNMVLRAAYDGRVDCIVSGDKHILALGSFRGIAIRTVVEMLEEMGR